FLNALAAVEERASFSALDRNRPPRVGARPQGANSLSRAREQNGKRRYDATSLGGATPKQAIAADGSGMGHRPCRFSEQLGTESQFARGLEQRRRRERLLPAFVPDDRRGVVERVERCQLERDDLAVVHPRAFGNEGRAETLGDQRPNRRLVVGARHDRELRL